ncbi:MAG: hypothetical protein P8H55_02805 [Hellea sp.]|nr:hypothetical protein [Hellea sp.]MDG1666086.1 hypothetical protein [Hellea sp.]
MQSNKLYPLYGNPVRSAIATASYLYSLNFDHPVKIFSNCWPIALDAVE